MNLVCIGAANLDQVIRSSQPLSPADSNPAGMVHSAGGVACNMATAICATVTTFEDWPVPLQITLVAGIGQDIASKQLIACLGDAPFDIHWLSQPLHPTGQYTAVLDHEGNLVHGFASTTVSETLAADPVLEFLDSFDDLGAVVIDTNLSATCIEHLTNGLPGNLPLYANTVSMTKARRLLPISNRITTLFTNRLEAAALTDLPADTPLPLLDDSLSELGFNSRVITDGGNALLYATSESPDKDQDQDQDQGRLQPDNVSVTGVNGAGDALAGATIAGLVNELTLPEALVRHGLPAARSHLQHNGND